MTNNWSQTDRARLELSFVGILILSYLFIPLAVKELFPFSAATMFAFECRELASYEVRDPDGKTMDGAALGLEYGPNIFDPPVDTLGRFGYGRQSPASVLKPGSCDNVASQAAVEEMVKQKLSLFPKIKYVLVTQTIYGAVDKKTVGVVRQLTWKITNSKSNID